MVRMNIKPSERKWVYVLDGGYCHCCRVRGESRRRYYLSFNEPWDFIEKKEAFTDEKAALSVAIQQAEDEVRKTSDLLAKRTYTLGTLYDELEEANAKAPQPPSAICEDESKLQRYVLRSLAPKHLPQDEKYGVFKDGMFMVAWTAEEKYAKAIVAALNDLVNRKGDNQ